MVARGAGGHWPLGLGRVAAVRWLTYPAAAWIRQAPVASSMAAYRKIPRRPRPAGVGRVKSVDLDLSMSGEDIRAAIGLVQPYAGTRPQAVGLGPPNRS